MIITVLIGYIPEPHYFVEFTAISNLSCGIIILVDGILNLKNKQVPNIIYIGFISAMWVLSLLCLLGAFGLYELNFHGAFFFLHVINPLLFILSYLLFYQEKGEKKRQKVIAAPYVVASYFTFDYILGQIRGHFVYGLFAVNSFKFVYAILALLALYLVTALFGSLSIFLNTRISKHLYKQK